MATGDDVTSARPAPPAARARVLAHDFFRPVGAASSFTAFWMSAWYFNSTCSVSVIVCGSVSYTHLTLPTILRV